VKRGDVWISSRFGRDRKVVIVGLDRLTADRDRVIVVPISEAFAPDLVAPTVSMGDGETLGVAQIPYVGDVGKTSLTLRAGVLTPLSVESVNIGLRAALDL
jgi:mRNA-degrading endonuclease toxin of MazEF toxin-antitoxin module